MPIDVLKIDKTFVRGLGQHQGDTEIVRLILALAHTLNLETIAEGVESQEHIVELVKLGCTLGQGYIFSPPVTSAEADELIRTATHFLQLAKKDLIKVADRTEGHLFEPLGSV